jgi:hypothetical protein
VSTAYRAKQMGWAVRSKIWTSADGHPVCVFSCGPVIDYELRHGRIDEIDAPLFNLRDPSFVELFVCGVPRRGFSVTRISGVPMSIWSKIEPRLWALNAKDIVAEVRLAEEELNDRHQLEEKWLWVHSCVYSG